MGVHAKPPREGTPKFRNKADQHGIDTLRLPLPSTQTFQIGINYETRAYLSNTSDDSSKVNEVYKKLGVDLSDSALKTQAITHKSFAHGSLPTNEKLGYLGKEKKKRRDRHLFFYFYSRHNKKPCLLHLGY